ncbi:MAG: hypothetical protein LBV75_08130 [Paludibacter sp.]|jgi:biotin carboxyl carrier protein|nr:hypothetical protein [Paludibacter sp.]
MKKFSFEVNGGQYEVNVKSYESDFAEIEVNGTPYSVAVHKVTSDTTKNLAATTPRPAVAGTQVVTPTVKASGAIKPIKSPLPGSMLKVNVSVGSTFKEGDVLCIMESMKMENNILAEGNGTITKVCAPVGSAVLQDEILFEYSEGTIVVAAPQPAVEAPKPVAPKPVVETPKPVAQPVAASSTGAKKFKSPLPGSVLKVNVSAGSTFKEGDVLCIMESMKMENNILAEGNGTVTKVCAPAGTAVLQDEVLFEYN